MVPDPSVHVLSLSYMVVTVRHKPNLVLSGIALSWPMCLLFFDVFSQTTKSIIDWCWWRLWYFLQVVFSLLKMFILCNLQVINYVHRCKAVILPLVTTKKISGWIQTKSVAPPVGFGTDKTTHLPQFPLCHHLMWFCDSLIHVLPEQHFWLKVNKQERKLSLHICSRYTISKYIWEKCFFINTQVMQVVAMKVWIAFNRKVNNS